jgi:hypothetical protein
MNAKEKAKELVEKYLNTIIHFPYIDTEDGNCIGTGYMTHYSAVRCAINAVDEILSSLSSEYIIYGSEYRHEVSTYYENVKSELLSL